MKLDCGCSEWEHELFYGECPPPLPPRPCCGVDETPENDIIWPCTSLCCNEYFCVCGRFLGFSSGPVGCGCDMPRSWNRPHADQRPKRPVPGGHRQHRRYLSRRGRNS